jgi:hypothetical protein
LFTLSRSKWSEADGIGGYSLFGWRENAFDLVMVADSRDLTLLLFFSENTFLLHLLVFIRDRFDSVIEVNVSSVSIDSNSTTIEAFDDTFTRLLSNLNQNLISQAIVSTYQVFSRQSMGNSSDCDRSGVQPETERDRVQLRVLLIELTINPSVCQLLLESK